MTGPPDEEEDGCPEGEDKRTCRRASLYLRKIGVRLRVAIVCNCVLQSLVSILPCDRNAMEAEVLKITEES